MRVERVAGNTTAEEISYIFTIVMTLCDIYISFRPQSASLAEVTEGMPGSVGPTLKSRVAIAPRMQPGHTGLTRSAPLAPCTSPILKGYTSWMVHYVLRETTLRHMSRAVSMRAEVASADKNAWVPDGQRESGGYVLAQVLARRIVKCIQLKLAGQLDS